MEKELLLLGMLKKQDMHGYRLTEFIDHYLALCTDIKKPTIYFLLDKMATAGWVSTEQTQEGKRPPRRVYHLTAQGEMVFQQMLRESLAMYRPVTFDGDIALAFLGELPQEEVCQLLEQRRAQINEAIKTLQSVPVHKGTTHWLFEHQSRHLAAEKSWLDELINRLAAGKNQNLSIEMPLS